MKKNRIKVISKIAILVIITIIGLACLWSYLDNYSKTLNINWGFSLPSEAHYSEVYSKDSSPSFHGDGIRYHIFSYKEARPINEMFCWKNTEEKTIYNASYQDAVTEWLNSINVSAENTPNYSDCLYWYESQDDVSIIL